MSSCCSEPNCRRIQPISIYKGDFSDTVYAVTRARLVRRHGEGRATMAAIEKHDVSAAMRRFLRDNREWALKILSEGESDA